MVFVGKVVLSALIISFCSWLAGKKPHLAGFIVALPLTTLLVLPFSYMEFQDTQASIDFAKSIFVAIPVSLIFFVPFLIPEKIPFGFWGCYVLGFLGLSLSYFVHKWALKFLFHS